MRELLLPPALDGAKPEDHRTDLGTRHPGMKRLVGTDGEVRAADLEGLDEFLAHITGRSRRGTSQWGRQGCPGSGLLTPLPDGARGMADHPSGPVRRHPGAPRTVHGLQRADACLLALVHVLALPAVAIMDRAPTGGTIRRFF